MSFLILSTIKKHGRIDFISLLKETGMGQGEVWPQLREYVKSGQITEHVMLRSPYEYEITPPARPTPPQSQRRKR